MSSKTTIYLVGLALALFGYIYFVDSRSVGKEESASKAMLLLPTFDPFQVTNVEITRSNSTIRAERSKGSWQLTTPPYPAQSTAIESLLHAIAGLQGQDEISAQEIISLSGGLSPFGLDPPKALVKVQQGTNVVQLRVGNKTLVGDRVYVQPVGASNIFITGASLLDELPSTPAQWRDPLLIPQDNLAVDHITIAAGARSFKLEQERTNRLWRLTEPMQRRADSAQVHYLIQQLRSARVVQFVSDDPKADLEPFGLVAPEAEVVLGLGTNVVFQAQIGKSPTNDPTLVYARTWNHTNVVLVSRALAELLGRHYTTFRDQILLSFRPASVSRIEVNAAESFALQRQLDSSWHIVEPYQAPADRELMQFFMDDLSRLEIVKFESDAVADFSPYGLVKPQRQYVLKAALTNGVTVINETLVEADFGASPTNEVGSVELDKVFCRRTDENSAYVIRSSDLLRLPSAAFFLRDRRIWTFESTNVFSVTILQGGAKRLLVRDAATGAWIKNDQVASAKIEETLHRLGELQADLWSGRGKEQARQFGAAPSNYQITLDLSEGGKQRQLVLSFGKLAPNGQPYAAVALEQDQPVIFKFPLPLYSWLAQYLAAEPTNANR